MLRKILCSILAFCMIFALITAVSAEEAQIKFVYEAGEFGTQIPDEDEGTEYTNTVAIKIIMKGAELTEKGVCNVSPFTLKWDKNLADLVATKSSYIEAHSGVNKKNGVSNAGYVTANSIKKENAVLGTLYFKLTDEAKNLNNKLDIKVYATEKTLVSFDSDVSYTYCFDEMISVEIPGGTEPEGSEEVEIPSTGGSTAGSSVGSGSASVSSPTTGGKTEDEETSETPLKPLTTMVLTINDCIMKVNNNTLINDVAPIIVSDRTMLPIRVVCQEFGASVEWDDTLKKVTVKGFGKTIEVFVGSEKAYVNGEEVILDAEAFIQNDRTYVPLRFVMENLEAKVDWNEELYQVTISK